MCLPDSIPDSTDDHSRSSQVPAPTNELEEMAQRPVCLLLLWSAGLGQRGSVGRLTGQTAIQCWEELGGGTFGRGVACLGGGRISLAGGLHPEAGAPSVGDVVAVDSLHRQGLGTRVLAVLSDATMLCFYRGLRLRVCSQNYAWEGQSG